MSDERRYRIQVQMCPRCGLSACRGIDCSDCRYRKYDIYMHNMTIVLILVLITIVCVNVH